MGTTDQEQEQLIDDYWQKFGQIETKAPPEILYHYTTNDVLLKIINNKNLWLTHALHMNDSKEFAHGMKLFKNELDTLEIKDVDKGWLDRIRGFFDREMANPTAQPYVFSMTEEPDQLSQWSGYGDDSCGVSIGFRTKELVALDGLHLKHLPVIYIPDSQKHVVKTVMQGFIDLIKSMDQKTLDDGLKWGPKLAGGYFFAAYLQSIRFKHNSWKEEREWRAVVLTSDKRGGWFTRSRGHSIIKSYELPTPNLQKLMGRIVMGPKTDKSTLKDALESLRVRDSLNFEISESDIPMKP